MPGPLEPVPGTERAIVGWAIAKEAVTGKRFATPVYADEVPHDTYSPDYESATAAERAIKFLPKP